MARLGYEKRADCDGAALPKDAFPKTHVGKTDPGLEVHGAAHLAGPESHSRLHHISVTDAIFF
jgi:hypothetical protein